MQLKEATVAIKNGVIVVAVMEGLYLISEYLQLHLMSTQDRAV